MSKFVISIVTSTIKSAIVGYAAGLVVNWLIERKPKKTDKIVDEDLHEHDKYAI